MQPASDVAFTPAVKAIQERLGSRRNYARVEQGTGWNRTIPEELAEFVEDDPVMLARLEDADYEATPERSLVFHVEAWDVNCPQHITPRFTREEIEPAIDELKTRNDALQTRVNELEALVAQERSAR